MTAEDVNLLKGFFSGRRESKLLAVGWDYTPFSGLAITFEGKGGKRSPGGCNKATLKESAFLVRSGIPGL